MGYEFYEVLVVLFGITCGIVALLVSCAYVVGERADKARDEQCSRELQEVRSKLNAR